ncbi:MAG: Zn-dependent hydrolase [Deltaproteobacteria bacterium]|nr:MAG: Zn-dependent hydrolase [Deltaproteobacteria bacterium]
MLTIDTQSLKSHLAHASHFGELPGGGITRLAFSHEEKQVRAYVKALMHTMGMTIYKDGIGNLLGILAGENPELPAVISGSHLDSVPNGGCYDGPLGVFAALEAVKAIQQSGQAFKRSLGVMVFSCEESSRFHMATLGSKLLSGKLSFEQLHTIKDDDGISVYEAAKQFGCSLDESTLPMKNDHFHGYIELHIEQGPVLENKGIPVGIVLAIAAPIRYKLNIIGHTDHSGATPMSMRKDALTCASEIILAIESLAKEEQTTVATVGNVKVTPGVLNVIPGEAELLIDIRDIDKAALIRTDKAIRQAVAAITQRRGLTFELTLLSKDFPTPMDTHVIDIIETVSKKVGIEAIKLPSGAGHDAMNMVGIASHTGMIFVPCKEGISHNVNEAINFADANQATLVLAHSLFTLANEEA